MTVWLRRAWFWLAFLAGPLAWVLMVGLGVARQDGWPDARLLLVIVVAAPILEELVFRGALQAWLFDQPWMRGFIGGGFSFANVVTSVLFAGFHAISQPPLWAMSVFIPSLVFGWARDRTQSVWPGMVLHAWYNLGFVLLFVR